MARIGSRVCRHRFDPPRRRGDRSVHRPTPFIRQPHGRRSIASHSCNPPSGFAAPPWSAPARYPHPAPLVDGNDRRVDSPMCAERLAAMTSTMGSPVDALRSVLADAVRSRVAGDPADAAALTAPGPRWFPPDAAIRTVHGDAAMFVGGLRALVLQSLHPLAMAGVVGHSGYRGDPWGRLQRTSRFLAATTFGPVDVAEDAVARVRAAHRRVRGTAPDGRPYRADDPHLLRWVHVAEVDSFLRGHRRFGATRPHRRSTRRVRRRGRHRLRQAGRDRPTDERSPS